MLRRHCCAFIGMAFVDIPKRSAEVSIMLTEHKLYILIEHWHSPGKHVVTLHQIIAGTPNPQTHHRHSHQATPAAHS